MINVLQPCVGQEELDAIEKVFKSNWLGKGKVTDEFEAGLAKLIGTTTDHICTTNDCTEGLFTSMEMFDVQEGDEVIMPTISFVGAGNAVCSRKAKLVLCDIDKRTLNARACDIEKKITSKTKAIMVIHYGGIPCEMDEIMELAKAHNLPVIEDSACSIYSTYKGKACGTIGDMGMWSFDAAKILTSGDGSMLYFKDPAMKARCEKWLYYGLETTSGYSNSEKVDNKWWEFEVSSFGARRIINDINAAIGVEQLKKLPSFVARRKEIADMYTELLKDIEWVDTPLPLKEYCTSTHFFYHIQMPGGQRDALAKYLKDNGIYSTFRYYPLDRVKSYGADGVFPNSDYAADNTLCLPAHQSLTNDEVQFISEKIIEFGKINNI